MSTALPLLVEAHGIGGQRDLPISLNLAVAGAVAALVISFGVLALAWRAPRYDGATAHERPAPAWLDALVGSVGFRVVLRILGMLVFLYTAFCAFFGQDIDLNPVFGIFFVILWVGLVPASFLFGPIYRAVSPVRTLNLGLSRLVGNDPEEGLYRYPERLGLWPAAIALYAFVWFELVYPYSFELAPVRFWCAVYVAAMLVGGLLFGNRFLACADPFEVYSSLVAKLSFWATREEADANSRLVIRSPLANLATLAGTPGLLAVITVLFGSTGFDSFKDSQRWITFVQGSSISGHLLNNIALPVFILVAGGVFSLATMLTGVHTEPRPEAAHATGVERLVAAVRARSVLPTAFAHSIIPIVLGYIVAHYLSFAFEVGSRTIVYMSDPLTNGSDLLGTADLGTFTWWSYHPQLLAETKVGAVVVGHIVAVVAAHDRAIRLLPARHRLVGQLPLLLAMIAFTSVGLYLLFAA